MRYNGTGIKLGENGKQVMMTTLLGKIKPRSSDVFVVMVDKTRLDHLAHKFYKNAGYWWIIASANNIKGTMFAESGKQIRIPMEINNIVSNHSSLNSN
jgi:hypothetical protein